jgi:hypothetical protein
VNIVKEADEFATMFAFTLRIFRFGKPLKKVKGNQFNIIYY